MQVLKQLLRNLRMLGLTLLGLALVPQAVAAEVKVAVAANFTAAMQQLAPVFEQRSGQRLSISYGSTGKLYAQVVNGAPFEVFLSADDRRGSDLIRQGYAVAGSEFIYASGRLALWSRQPGLVDAEGAILQSDSFRKLAIANPKTAPYGAAAVETLQALNLYEKLRPRLVQGENIAQTQQFVHSGNAELGLIALAQVKSLVPAQQGSYWLVPASLHRPVRQQAVLLKRGKQSQTARAFLVFLQSTEARAIIRNLGYDTD